MLLLLRTLLDWKVTLAFASPVRTHRLASLPRPSLPSTRVNMSSSSTSLAPSTVAAPSVRTCEPALVPPGMYRSTPPPHHSTDPSKREFHSPWPSAGGGITGLFSFLKIRLFEWEGVPLPPPNDRPQPVPCTFNPPTAASAGQILFTWIGHAGCHFRIPMPNSSEYVSVLTDPVLSNRCSPSQWIGPSRLQPPPTTVEEMANSTVPGVWPDVLVFSHNHYDHLDENTVKAILAQPNGRPVPHVFCTLGVADLLYSLGVPKDGLTELDWWQQRQISWPSSSGSSAERSLKLTCVPAQHFSGRGLTDRNHSVWGGWVMEAMSAGKGEDGKTSSGGKKVYFVGDSAYRRISRAHQASGESDDVLPYCPAFSEVGELLGPMDLSAIPIGAYKPRIAMSPVHMDPIEAVQVHKQARSKRSIGIHWGSFNLAAEPVHEPPKLLKEEAAKQGLAPDAFTVMDIGGTLAV